jgi:hypothetical protein
MLKNDLMLLLFFEATVVSHGESIYKNRISCERWHLFGASKMFDKSVAEKKEGNSSLSFQIVNDSYKIEVRFNE